MPSRLSVLPDQYPQAASSPPIGATTNDTTAAR